MVTHRQPHTTARHALWLGGLLVVLAGLFGMHGLDSHGAAGTDTIPHAVMAQVSTAAVGARYEAIEAVASGAQHAASIDHQVGSPMTSEPVAGRPEAPDSGMAEMCMAILAVALAALLRLLILSRHRPVPWVLFSPERAPSPSGRDPDPPSLISLSIHRC